MKGNMKPSKMGIVENKKVMLLKDEEAYYSGYAGNPIVIIKAGTVGIVGSTDVPYVCPMKDRAENKRRGDYFVCVDFEVEGKYSGNPKFENNIWRCGVNPKNLKLLNQDLTSH